MTRAVAFRMLLLLLIALTCAVPAGRAHAQDDEDEPLLDLDDDEERDTSHEESTQTTGSGELAEPDEDAADTDDDEGEEPASDEDEPEVTSTRSLAFSIGAGLGAGTLSFERPMGPRLQHLPDTAFAAAALELHLHAYPDDAVSVDIELEYETSLGMVVQIPKLFALPQNVNVRTQRVALSAAPMVRLGEDEGSAKLVFPIGFGFDAFTPEVDEYGLLEYSLGGPFARAELWFDLGESIGVRLGPEVEWLVVIDDALRNQGVCCQGLAVGAEGSIEARIGEVLRLALTYRESHASVPGSTFDFSDVERFMTARIVGAL